MVMVSSDLQGHHPVDLTTDLQNLQAKKEEMETEAVVVAAVKEEDIDLPLLRLCLSYFEIQGLSF